MPIRAAAVGRSWSARSAVELRWALAYAACLGFDGRHLDDAGTLVVPPSFCVCLEWLVAGDPIRHAILGNSETERLRSVHALQDSVFHAPLLAGTAVDVVATVVAVAAVSAGTLVEIDIVTAERDGGRMLVSTRFAVIFRDVACDGEARIASDHPPLPPPAGTSAAATTETAIAVPRGLPHVYSECARIWNPIHTERRVALAAGLPDIILHGTATWALAARKLSARRGPDSRLRRLAARFRAPVVPGSIVHLRSGEDAPGTDRFVLANGDGRPALGDGIAVFD